MATQSLFFALALMAVPARRSQTNLALAIASVAFACALGRSILLHWSGHSHQSAYFWAALRLPLLFIPPFIHLHIIGLTAGGSWRFKPRDLRHGVFCIAGPLLLALAMALHSESLARHLGTGIPLITALHGGYCLMAGLALTRQPDRPQIAWVRLLLLGLCGLLISFAAIHAAPLFFGYLPWAGLSTTLIAMLVFYGITWAGLSHSKVFTKSPEEVFHALVAPVEKYRHSRQSAQDAKRILAKLGQTIEAQSLYRDANLSLPALAAKIGAKPNSVSQALNQTLGVSFNDYINGRRIDEAKRLLLAAGADETILDIAYKVGFNSKSTFNTVFKKHTGQTPTLFRKQSDPSPTL